MLREFEISPIQVQDSVDIGEISPVTEQPRVVDLSTFKESKELAGDVSWVVQFKGFNRQERISRQLTQISAGQAGSSTDREISPGAIMIFPTLPQEGTLDIVDASANYLVKDSRGLAPDLEHEAVYFGSVDEILKLDLKGNTIESVATSETAPLAFVHSLSLSADGKRILATSSGLDRIVEIDIESGAPAREWIAWEHGYNRAVKSRKLVFTTLPEPRPEEDFIVIDDVKKVKGGLGLPPAERTAFPNSASYIDENTIAATFFHHGLVKIDLETGDTQPVDIELKHPHSVLPFGEGYVVTNTAQGQAIILNKDLTPSTVLDFTQLPGLDPNATGREWLQHVRPISETRLAAVDSNRTSIFIVDLKDESIQKVPFQENWVIQEIHPLPKITG